ncbi:hypothetical protein CYMTET_19257 [Cymbomonas tetramitiformis]|uniref:Uncharacterized protein n=1 Tax=Cymbomonas tetramitiformis TaxID=36881 RepID=A0AAE0G6Y9_9CHLO|nr:hypothetical protein CYMTET_19257 [Cymbomonas tetramitiformis]
MFQADNLKAPSAVNTGRLAGKEDLYMKKAVKRYIDHWRWKKVSEVSTKAEDDGVEEETPAGDESDDEIEMEIDGFALSDEEDDARDARLKRNEERKKVEEFEARADKLTRFEKRNEEFKEKRNKMDGIAAELEKKEPEDREVEEKLKAKLEEKAAELRAAKMQRKALIEEVEKKEEEEVPEPLDGYCPAVLVKVAKGVTKKKKQVSDPKIMFRLRKHTMAGVVQDPAVLTSRAVIRAGKLIPVIMCGLIAC